MANFVNNNLRIAVKVPAPRPEAAHEWGDYYFALTLKSRFEAEGHSVRIDLLLDWDTKRGLGDDVVLVLRGLSAYQPKPGQLNVMWHISHPDLVRSEEMNLYDCILVAAESEAERLKRALKRPVYSMLQCVDEQVFYPDQDPSVPAWPVLLVGNSRKQRREIVFDAIAAGIPLSVYGTLWEGLIPAEYIKGSHIPQAELRKYYSNAAVVLNDHRPDMARRGFISNRIFDAGACGACVVSDQVTGLKEIFGDAVMTYQDARDLSIKVNQLLSDENLRRRQGQKLSALVNRGHTFSQRAA